MKTRFGKCSVVLLFAVVFALFAAGAAMAMTEWELVQICRMGSAHELQGAIARDKSFVNTRFHDQDTPLMVAADKANNPEILQVLINAGADVNAQNEDGETALMKAMDEDVNPACVNVLLKAGAKVNLKEDDGETALMKALDENVAPEVIIALLDAGADARAKDARGRSVIGYYALRAYRIHGTEAMSRLEAAGK